MGYPSYSFISDEDYIRWVQRSLNRLLGVDIKVNGRISSEYRFNVEEFQLGYALTISGDVDYPTHNTLVKANHIDPIYVDWVYDALAACALGTGLPSHHGMEKAKPFIKLFQERHKLGVDGWVGAKTETALLKASKIKPPGEKAPPKPKPKPKPFVPLVVPLTPQQRYDRLVGRMYHETRGQTGPSLSVSDRKRLLCFLRKLRDASSDTAFIYSHTHIVNAHLYVFGKETGTYADGYKPDDITYDVREELMKFINKAKTTDHNVLYEDFRVELATLFDNVNMGLVKIGNLYNTQGDSSAAALSLHVWARGKQKSKTSILACFTIE